jgi:cellulose synthase/poly-beta-1,6-N-acetylglucosamine synthase-like glycosyltransferase
MLIAYCILLFILLWGYGLYALPLMFFRRKGFQKFQSLEHWPVVSFVIPAFNEADYLVEKIKNTLALDYPAEKLQIIVAADGSDDNSAEVASGYKVLFLNNGRRDGKASAMNRCIEHCTGDVVVFSDANVMVNTEGLKALASTLYSHSDVALVSGEKKVIKAHEAHNAGAGEGVYWKYETALKKIDSNYFSLIGSVGELFAIRKERYVSIPPHFLLDDFFVSVELLKQGYKVKYVSEALATEYGSSNYNEEAKRKVRIAAGAWQCMKEFRALLNPFNKFKASYLYVSHRVLRQSIIPFSLIIFMPILLLLMHYFCPNYFVTFNLIGFATLFFLGLIGWYFNAKLNHKKAPFIVNVPFYILFMNVCAIAGAFRYFKGIKSGAWEKSKRAK